MTVSMPVDHRGAEDTYPNIQPTWLSSSCGSNSENEAVGSRVSALLPYIVDCLPFTLQHTRIPRYSIEGGLLQVHRLKRRWSLRLLWKAPHAFSQGLTTPLFY
jgi:hypothetical protein